MKSPSGLYFFAERERRAFLSCQLLSFSQHTEKHTHIVMQEYLDGLDRRLVQAAEVLLNFKIPSDGAPPRGGPVARRRQQEQEPD